MSITGAIIQARMGSNRLPNKVMLDLIGKPVLQHVIERTMASRVDKVIVATTTNIEDNAIAEFCKSKGYAFYRGSENNVLRRVLDTAKLFKLDIIVEITADCPLIDWNHIDHLLSMHEYSNKDITGNIIGGRTFPRGYDIRIFNTKILERINKEVDNDIDRQHVSTWAYLNPKGKLKYTHQNWMAPFDQRRSDIEVTLDTPEDYELIKWLFEVSKEYRLELNCSDVVYLLSIYPENYNKVKDIKRKDYFEELANCYGKKK